MEGELARIAAKVCRRFLAKYKSKKKVKTKDGEERVIYEYGPRQVQRRHQEKAERLEELRHSIDEMRDQVYEDLSCDDPETCSVALAVALMDHTYERVGNSESADKGHFGVTGWRVDHVRFSKGKATLEYVGKSGVEQEKDVTDARLLSALKKAVKGKDPDDEIVDASAEEVNAYLKEFGITAKDIRGFHANESMKERLAKIRSKGPKLPKERKKKDEILKKEFQKALEETAKAVGHEPTTLRNQYLVPSLEETFMHDGEVIDALDS